MGILIFCPFVSVLMYVCIGFLRKIFSLPILDNYKFYLKKLFSIGYLYYFFILLFNKISFYFLPIVLFLFSVGVYSVFKLFVYDSKNFLKHFSGMYNIMVFVLVVLFFLTLTPNFVLFDISERLIFIINEDIDLLNFLRDFEEVFI